MSREYPYEEEHIVLTVYAPGGEHNDRNYIFQNWDRALEVAENRASEGFRVVVKRRKQAYSDWEERTFNAR